MEGRVINIKSGERYDVYIGRGSRFGNPYSHIPGKGKFPVDSREDAIKLYEEYIRERPELMAEAKKLKGKVLACYCKPLKCHGDILLKIANEEDV
jgi:hypothetical protein